MMDMFLRKLLTAVLSIHIYLAKSVTATLGYVASFQTDITGSPSATSNVWIEYEKHIPMAKDFTVCHWIKIKFYNIDTSASLWSYCTIEKEGQKMECLQAEMMGNIQTAYRDLEFLGQINLKNYDDLKILSRKRG